LFTANATVNEEEFLQNDLSPDRCAFFAGKSLPSFLLLLSAQLLTAIVILTTFAVSSGWGDP
jgi:hypothetical protein